MPPTLLKSQAYTSFVSKRDAALERIHQHAQIDLSRILFEVLEQIERLTASMALKVGTSYLTHSFSRQYEIETQSIFASAFPMFLRRLHTMRKASFILSYASEMEAVGRATKRKHRLTRSEFQNLIRAAVSSPTLEGALDKRVWHDLMVLRRRMIHAFELGITQDLKPQELIDKVKSAFPKLQVYKRPPKALTKLKESGQDNEDEDKTDWLDLDFIDDSDWNIMVSAYNDTELPPSRFDKSASWDSDSGLMKYNWELEQETTEDFVKTVRSGQHQGASAMGVKDFVWVAVIDDRTCDDCCVPRNGKTTSQIEEFDDDCGVTVPPAHFNCRCQIAPVATTDEVQGPDVTDFKDWLSQA